MQQAQIPRVLLLNKQQAKSNTSITLPGLNHRIIMELVERLIDIGNRVHSALAHTSKVSAPHRLITFSTQLHLLGHRYKIE